MDGGGFAGVQRAVGAVSILLLVMRTIGEGASGGSSCLSGSTDALIFSVLPPHRGGL